MARYRGNSHDLATQMSRKGGGPVTVCDYTGFMTNQADMVRQLAYNGTGLYETGFVVHKRFADAPNPQNLSPVLDVDPPPLTNVKFDAQGLGQALLTGTLFDLEGKNNPYNVAFPWQPTFSWIFTNTTNAVFNTPFVCQFPQSIFQMTFVNETDNQVCLGVQGSPFASVTLNPGQQRLLSWNLLQWQDLQG